MICMGSECECNAAAVLFFFFVSSFIRMVRKHMVATPYLYVWFVRVRNISAQF
ncbi:hypothetical protein BT96DRAFT_61376 [Gymnopus androsaceus JB14]|uniref:Uncharacterized protein n=1 Tax=Gymnopus androsaceus JB14 TaxID=1447944 RepID=A0A6A4HJT6_9AGAR|nr:hypothetical protein BT96DRAFT_61376 [Gymnopus androsaceus JB14]